MTPLRVLIVEDEFLVADYIEGVIADAGHEVVACAASAVAALELLRTHEVDVAVLDIRLSGKVDGVALAYSLREVAPRTPHLFISGSGDPETRARALETRPVGFLQKPFAPEQLTQLLAECRMARAAE
jgi:DNA-binding NtrC family response regulator